MTDDMRPRYHVTVGGVRRYFALAPDVKKLKAGEERPLMVQAPGVVAFPVRDVVEARWMLRAMYESTDGGRR